MRLTLLLPLLAFGLAACDGLEPEGDVSQVFVESYQIAGEPLEQVRLMRTAALSGVFDPADQAIRDADVAVDLLADDGSVAETYPFRESRAGVYVPLDRSVEVQPLRRYRLRATTPDGDEVTATTLVPDTLRLLAVSADTVVYQAEEQFEARVSRSEYPGRQNIYIFSSEALVPIEENLVPVYRAILVDDGTIDPDDLADFRLNQSPPLNEANYEVEGDAVTIPLPWLGVAFFGPNRISINALDTNLYDFVRSATVQRDGGAGLSPGEIASLLENVEGGTGVFGSYARAQARVYIVRR